MKNNRIKESTHVRVKKMKSQSKSSHSLVHLKASGAQREDGNVKGRRLPLQSTTLPPDTSKSFTQTTGKLIKGYRENIACVKNAGFDCFHCNRYESILQQKLSSEKMFLEYLREPFLRFSKNAVELREDLKKSIALLQQELKK